MNFLKFYLENLTFSDKFLSSCADKSTLLL
jgi:hypothetical protein